MRRPPPAPTLFPYTTLFRSLGILGRHARQPGAGGKPLISDGLSKAEGRVQPSNRRARSAGTRDRASRSEEHTSELQSRGHLVCRLLLEKKKTTKKQEPRRRN